MKRYKAVFRDKKTSFQCSIYVEAENKDEAKVEANKVFDDMVGGDVFIEEDLEFDATKLWF